jgi:hypothetical protein
VYRSQAVQSTAQANPYAERLIGSIRRECLDHVVVFNESHLRRVLSRYVVYYHRARTHLSLVRRTHPRRARFIPPHTALASLRSRKSAASTIDTNGAPLKIISLPDFLVSLASARPDPMRCHANDQPAH